MASAEITHFGATERGTGWESPPTWFAVSVAELSAAAAGIHGSVVGEHFREAALFGMFFAVASGLQLAWAFLVLVRPFRALYVCGAVGNGLIVATWAVSRTVGFPLGPEPGVPEAASFVDLATTMFEISLVAGCVLALLPPAVAAMRERRSVFFAGVCVCVATGGVAILALISASVPAGSSVAVRTSAAGHALHLAVVLAVAGAVALGNLVADRVRSRRSKAAR